MRYPLNLPDSEIYSWLAIQEEKFADILSKFGEPELRLRPEGFRTLVYIIIEQQISLQAANTIFARLEASLIRIEPEIVVHTPVKDLRTIGLNRQKIRTLFELSNMVINQQLDLRRFKEINDDEIRNLLVAVKGIGNWTVDIYFLESLNRPDILPVTDLALARCIQQVWGLEKKPRRDQIVEMAEKWKPWRSYAVRLIWSAYLNGQKPV